MSAAMAGLGSVLGRPGLGLGMLLIFLVGNPLSAVAAAPELLPEPWGAVGQWLPIGAGATLLRSTAYFDGAGAGRALLVLSVWAVMGLALVLLGRSRPVPGPAVDSDSARDAARRLRAASGRSGDRSGSRRGVRRVEPEWSEKPAVKRPA